MAQRSKKQRSQAAKKGWETRKKKAAALAKKSKGGRPSHVQKQTAPRSQAAKKGWETRRKKNPLRWGKEQIKERKRERKRIEDKEKGLEGLLKKFEKFVELVPKQKAKLQSIDEEIAKLEEEKRNLKRFGESHPEKWEMKVWESFQDFVFTRDANEHHVPIVEKHRKLYQWKQWIRKEYGQPFFAQWMEMIGTAWGLPRYGKFSIESFITS